MLQEYMIEEQQNLCHARHILQDGTFASCTGSYYTKYKLPNTKYTLPNTKYKLPNTKYKLRNNKYALPNTVSLIFVFVNYNLCPTCRRMGKARCAPTAGKFKLRQISFLANILFANICVRDKYLCWGQISVQEGNMYDLLMLI